MCPRRDVFLVLVPVVVVVVIIAVLGYLIVERPSRRTATARFRLVSGSLDAGGGTSRRLVASRVEREAERGGRGLGPSSALFLRRLRPLVAGVLLFFPFFLPGGPCPLPYHFSFREEGRGGGGEDENTACTGTKWPAGG